MATGPTGPLITGNLRYPGSALQAFIKP